MIRSTGSLYSHLLKSNVIVSCLLLKLISSYIVEAEIQSSIKQILQSIDTNRVCTFINYGSLAFICTTATVRLSLQSINSTFTSVFVFVTANYELRHPFMLKFTILLILKYL